jgi:hypothetical protein
VDSVAILPAWLLGAGASSRRENPLLPRASILVHAVKALEKIVFGPCTLWRTWGTRPEPEAAVERSDLHPKMLDVLFAIEYKPSIEGSSWR